MDFAILGSVTGVSITLLVLMVLLFFFVGFPFLVAREARRQNRSFILFFLLCYIISPVCSYLLLRILGPGTPPPRKPLNLPANQTKKCPNCSEVVRINDKTCPDCLFDFTNQYLVEAAAKAQKQ